VTIDGFGVGVFAEDTGPVRFMAYSPTGDLFVTVPAHDRVLVLPDEDHDGVSDKILIFAEGAGLNYPHGLAFRPGWLYVANTDSVIRYPYERGDIRARTEPELVVPLPGGPKHRTRTILFGPDRRMYVSIGSSCNVCAEEDERRATVMRFEVDGGGAALFARGLRNAVGLAVNPTTGELWATENGRDGMGDDLPPDELNRLVAGANYGWPYCFGNQVVDPDMGREELLCQGTVAPAVEFQAHSAPLGLAFYTGDQFPEEYHGDLFVAYHGSWDRSIPTGYNVVRVPFEDGYPSAPTQGFVHGWLRRDTRRWGRPVDIVVSPDGSLMVSDDAGERVYRVFYAPPRVPPTRIR
jgi:glucose/arabinose dehydrogenase